MLNKPISIASKRVGPYTTESTGYKIHNQSACDSANCVISLHKHISRIFYRGVRISFLLTDIVAVWTQYPQQNNDAGKRQFLLQFISEFLGHGVRAVLYDLLERTQCERKNEVPALPSHWWVTRLSCQSYSWSAIKTLREERQTLQSPPEEKGQRYNAWVSLRQHVYRCQASDCKARLRWLLECEMKCILSSQQGKDWETERKKDMTAEFPLPRSSFLSENRESSKLMRGKGKSMRGKGVGMGEVNEAWGGGERDKERRSESKNLMAVSGW